MIDIKSLLFQEDMLTFLMNQKVMEHYRQPLDTQNEEERRQGVTLSQTSRRLKIRSFGMVVTNRNLSSGDALMD